MKSRFFLASALLLAGCQITENSQQESVATNQESAATAQDNSHPTSIQNDVVSPSPLATAVQPQVAEPVPAPVITPQEQDDVWQRIAMQLRLDVPDNKSVNYYRNWYLKHPGHFSIVSSRAEPFLYYITEAVEKRGMPLELALLPIVESSFDQFAYSHGRAAGLWQIIPGTGRQFGLKQNWWYDGRRDVVQSTEAALDLLAYLNRRFDGNWLHALAAYNSGEGRVFRAIRENKKAGKSTDFWALDLPRETSGYVPKLLAVADIIKNQDKYGVDVPFIANETAVETVDPKTQMDLAMAAKYAGLSLSELKALNPAYNQWATAPDGQTHLLLPSDKVDTFNQAFEKSGRQGMKVIRYQIKSGDSLSVLAKTHRTSVDLIQRANKIDGSGIRAGKYILIPVAMNGENAFPSLTNQVRSQVSHGGGYRTIYKVESGDNLWTIAKKQKVSIKEIMKWNGLSKKSTLQIGQKLNIWKTSKNGGVIRTVYYEVRSGDNLSVIADKFKVKLADVIKWNQLGDKKYLQPGQKLKLFVDVTKVSV
ncbi:LysM peptidoglycan-binding domain-containing protein [Photobacterium galatheae]|uniref:Murein transglycosylase n=1 Tax=Photobacterium galatheae TaxID=1654360 RepID=A0A066RQ78_9GAMM|nr:LysM peptidoglycan-binding domain-containing protein [Photobacterium galatheae]KDM91241.1 murein transglycosylase [Photobacterium galatheae]MCM0148588.1 LysM peptidoglycan-binding domain-containing protein [Photobacterium galatheae]